MPLLQGIIQILIEHSDKFWGITKRSGKRNRPLSIIFVGTDLTAIATDSSSVDFDISSEQFRSLTRSSPAGCNDDHQDISVDHQSDEENSTETSQSEEDEQEQTDTKSNSDLLQQTVTFGKNETIIDENTERRKSEPLLPLEKESQIRENFKKSPSQPETAIVKPAHRRTNSGVHVPFRKKKVKRLLNL